MLGQNVTAHNPRLAPGRAAACFVFSARGPPPAARGMDQARQTLLDNDGPLVKFNGSTGKWCCMLCKRQFPAEKQLGQHLTASDLHKTNLAAAVASGRIIRSSGPPSFSSAHTAADVVRKRAREHDAEQSLPQRNRVSTLAVLHQMEEFERALQGRAGASSSGGGGGKEPLYRDRAKERRETQGSAPQHADVTGVRSARNINGNLDWRCGHCNKLNFARELACISCTREVDEDTEYAIYRYRYGNSGRCTMHVVCAYLNRYIDSSDYQKQRQRGMMKLAQRLEPGLLASHQHSDQDPHGERITRRV